MSKDYYAILGIEKDADEATIKKAYRKLAHKYHPDKNSDHKAEDKFKDISEAYSVLMNPEERKRYDSSKNTYVHNGKFEFHFKNNDIFMNDYMDIFIKAMNNSTYSNCNFKAYNRNYEVFVEKGSDITVRINIKFEESVLGCKKTIRVKVNEICDKCKENIGFCTTCGGTQLISKDKCFSFMIPQGINNGEKICLSGQGNASASGGKNGDIFVLINVLENPWFIRKVNDIYLECHIDLHTAICGGEIEVPYINSVKKIKIPESSSTNTVMKLKGEGIKTPDGIVGDFVIFFIVEMPVRVSDKGKEIIKEFLQHSHYPLNSTFNNKLKEYKELIG